jgi:hypothetical protein
MIAAHPAISFARRRPVVLVHHERFRLGALRIAPDPPGARPGRHAISCSEDVLHAGQRWLSGHIHSGK